MTKSLPTIVYLKESDKSADAYSAAYQDRYSAHSNTPTKRRRYQHQTTSTGKKSTMDTAITNTSTTTDHETSSADQKILNDLNILTEKMDQCQTQLNEQKMGHSNVFSTTNELYNIVGFLEACAPRMVELVEFCATQPLSGDAATAPLSDSVLMKALEVNDQLIKTLSDLDQVIFQDNSANVETTTSGTAQSTSNEIQQSTSEDEFDAFLSVRANEAAIDDDLIS